MTNTIKTTCAYCGVGCGVEVQKLEAGTEATKVSPDKSHPANGGALGGVLCSKGSALGETLQLGDRLLYPKINGERADWDTALNKVAKEFKHAIDEHGPESVAFYVSGQLLTEDYYVANKLMKGYIGSANIDTNSRLCMSSAVAGHKRAFGSDTVPGCYEDFELADLIVLVGANTAWCHPILFKRIQDAKRAGRQLMVVDPRCTPSASQADLHLPLKAGSDVLLFNGLLVWLADHNALNHEYITAHCDGFEATLAQARLDAPNLQSVAEGCDLSIDDLTRFYSAFETTERSTTLFSMGVNQSSQGTDKVNAIINCHLATGRVGKPGASPFSMTGQPNAMGGREAGGLANMLAAHMDFDQAERVQTFWDSPTIATTPGHKAVDLFEQVEAGKIKALWIMATNPAVSLPNVNQVRKALSQCDFVAVSDCTANTDTMTYADVALPAAAWGEKNGTVTNSERCISRQRPFVPLPGEARGDWWIISQVAQRMGYSDAFDYISPAEIFSEHARLSAFENNGKRDFDIGGLSDLSETDYNALEPVQWPVRSSHSGQQGQGTQRLFADGEFFTRNKKARFVATAASHPGHSVSEQFPLTLNSGRLRDHWHTMTRTGKSAHLSGHRSEPLLAIHPEDALKYGLQDSGICRVTSRWGTATFRANISKEQRRGEIFLPIHWTDQYASDAITGKLVNPVVDPHSGQPEFKHTPVKVAPAPQAWHAFSLTQTPVENGDLIANGVSYWTKITGVQHSRYELAGEQPLSDPKAWAHQLLNANQVSTSPAADWLEYSDESSGIYRAALIQNNQLLGCVVLAKTVSELPSRDWLSRLFSNDEINANDRAALLLGEAPDPDADVGPIVCSCFAVGTNTINKAIAKNGFTTAAQIGGCLKAGTNCGSCVPELEGLLATAQKSS